MLMIRREQMEVFDKESLRRFEEREIARLRASFPEKTKEMGDPEIRKVIAAGIESAEKYEVTDEVDVQRYLNFMFRYGYDFDTAPDTPWSHEILADKHPNGTSKMNALEEYEFFELTMADMGPL